MWEDRVAAIRAGGIEALADAVMERWFSKAFRQTEALTAWRNMLIRQPAEGYIGCASAIAGTDFYTTTATLTLPTLAIAGTEDGSTPARPRAGDGGADPRSRFHLMRGAGTCPAWRSPASMRNC
jgi:3-oxoadipate enol-lactonase